MTTSRTLKATPRTDAAIERGECGPDFARELESELVVANDFIAKAFEAYPNLDIDVDALTSNTGVR